MLNSVSGVNFKGDVTPNPNIQDLISSPGQYASLAEAKDAGAAILTYGNFITAVLNFLIVAFAIFIVFKKILVPHHKKEKVAEVTPAPVTEKECPYCKSVININATRCPHCTSELK